MLDWRHTTHHDCKTFLLTLELVRRACGYCFAECLVTLDQASSPDCYERAMNALPRAARWYLYGIWLTAGIAIAIAFRQSETSVNIWLLLTATVSFTIADLFAVTIEVDEGERVMMTVVDTLEVFLTAIMGAYGVLAVLLGSLASDLIAHRPWYKGLFNGAQRSLAYLAILQVYTLVMGPDARPFAGPPGLLALLLMVALFFVLNPAFVAGIVATSSGQSLLRIYGASLRQVQWIHFITLPLGAVLAVVWSYEPWMLIAGIAPIVMAHRSFAAIASLQAESRRNKALARQAQATTAKLERLQDTTTTMLSSLEPQPLLALVNRRLATLLEAPAAWAILFEPPRLVATVGVAKTLSWDLGAYRAELQQDSVSQIDGEALARLHPAGGTSWSTLLLLPMVSDSRLLGAFCFGLDAPMALDNDERRVLLAFAAQAAMVVERTQLFDQLRSNQEELIRSSKLAALGTFAAGIAHEFNNLLAAVHGFAELGLSSDDVAEKNEALEVALRTSRRGQSITSGLLTFARRRESRQEPCQLEAVVDETLMLIERELAKAGITLARDYQPIPVINCDPGQIAQVVMNLLTNARDAMAEQGGGAIVVGLRAETEHVVLSVGDSGSGIPEELRSQIFQPFLTTKGALGGSRTPGTGLGLAIIHGIVQAHGGAIQVESTVGVGSTFTIRLPIRSQTAEVTPPPEKNTPRDRVHVLVVDDESDVAESLCRLLQRQGFQASIATSGQAALDYYRTHPVDLVLSDVIMPDMDGPELLRQLLAANPYAVVLGMTGQLQTPQAEDMRKLGARAMLRKPFEMTELIRAIRTYAADSAPPSVTAARLRNGKEF
jgi:two-component system, NtrC family, sensor kinase